MYTGFLGGGGMTLKAQPHIHVRTTVPRAAGPLLHSVCMRLLLLLLLLISCFLHATNAVYACVICTI